MKEPSVAREPTHCLYSVFLYDLDIVFVYDLDIRKEYV